MRVKLKFSFHNEIWPSYTPSGVKKQTREEVMNDLGIEETGVLYFVVPEGETIASYKDLADLPGVKEIEVVMEDL